MIKNTNPHRPGLTAIAVVMALSSTSALAQVTLPADPAAPALPSVTSAAPAVQAPAAPAPVQTVQSIPATPVLPDLPVDAAAPAPKAAAPVSHRMATRAETPKVSPPAEARAVPAAPAAIADAAPAPVQPAVTPVDAAPAPMATTPVVTPVETAAPMPANDTGNPDYAAWALLGGGTFLVMSGAAFALTRRPKRRDEEAAYRADEASATVAIVAVHPAPLPAAMVREKVAPAPVRAEPALTRDYADATPDARRNALEALVAEAPSEANPFHSRRNRLRRADFLLRTGQAEPRQGEYAVTEESAAATAAQKDRWSEMRFQGGQKARINWRPFRN